jgi:hypothetical protein
MAIRLVAMERPVRLGRLQITWLVIDSPPLLGYIHTF